MNISKQPRRKIEGSCAWRARPSVSLIGSSWRARSPCPTRGTESWSATRPWSARAVREIGYVDQGETFSAETLIVEELITEQSDEIRRGANPDDGDQGAGDQGLMIGYATDETPELMPLPILLAHRLTQGLAEDRKTGREVRLRPDGKAQVTVRYENDAPIEVEHVVVSTQHAKGLGQAVVHAYVREDLAPRALGDWITPATGDPEQARAMLEQFDFHPAAIIDQLGLLAPLYRRTMDYGHFGRPGLPWEEDAAVAFATEATKERERRIGS